MQEPMDFKFPQYLSAPIQIVVMESDTFFVFMFSFCAAMVFKGWAYLLVIVMPYIYSKLKKRFPNGYFKHLVYIAGLKDLKGYPEAFETEFTE
ncbi:MAG: conjugal transfer protein TraL [bacterium]|nr:conjugal transfer protein TraL [bacterium]